MTQDEIIEMARQAGFSGSVAKMWSLYFEAFAKLVAAKAIAELESQETVALEALVMICVKCRSNEWGPDTPRKQILNWFHDTASKALEDAQIFRGQA